MSSVSRLSERSGRCLLLGPLFECVRGFAVPCHAAREIRLGTRRGAAREEDIPGCRRS